MPLNPDMLTSEMGLALAKSINKHMKESGEKRNAVHELHWKAELVMSNGDVLELSEW